MADLIQFASPESNTPFPNIVLLRDNRPCAAIGYLPESTGTLVVAKPVVFPDASGEVHRALCVQLLEYVKRHAVSEGMQRLHLLLPASDGETGFVRLLLELGFVQATQIVQWDLTVAVSPPCSPPDRSTLQLIDFEANAAVGCEIRFAIDAILECSEDLTNQPPPTAAELLRQWQRLHASVFVYRVEQEIAGLMSCATNRINPADAAATSTMLASEVNVWIEYIGVLPAFRRKQIASRMISLIPTQLSSVCDAHNPQALRVTAYSDAANTPANRLYERCGFVQTTGHHLWCCDVAKTNDDAGE